MPSVLCKAQIGAGTPASGAVTVAQGDVITLSLASTSGLQTFLWEIYSHPVNDSPLASGYNFPCPSGWTTDPDGYTYTYSGAVPPTLTIPSGAFWGKILIRCTCNGDSTLRDETLMLRLDSPAGVEDAAPFETNQADSVRSYSRAIQKFLRMFSTSVGDVQNAFVWDTTQASSAAVGRYATFAEIVAAIGSTESPVTVQLIGTPTTSGTATYEWENVTFKSDDAAMSITFTEGVVVKNARFDVAGIVTSTATTTTNLQYAPGAKVNLRGRFSAGTVGLLGVDGDGTVEFRLADGSLLSTYAFHSDAGDTLNVYTGATEWEAGAVDHFEGSAGTVNTYRSSDTIGEVETDTYAGTINRYVPSTPEKIQGVTVNSASPTIGYVLTATSTTAAEWAINSAVQLRGVGIATSAATPAPGDVLRYSTENGWEAIACDAASINSIGISGSPKDGMVLRAVSTAAAEWRTPDLLWSPSSFVAASSGSASGAVDICCGQEFEVYRDYYCDGVRFRWATNSGTPTCTVELWDDAGAVLKTTTQVVSTSATTYEVLFGTPQDLSSYKAKKLVVSVWQQTGGRHYSMVVTSPVGDAAPALIGRDVWSRGSIYSAGHAFPATNTSAEVYGVEPILRLK